MRMKINRQFQALHAHGGWVDWVLKQHLERDICLLYHQMANYSYIMGDLYYGSVFGLAYWEYIDFPGLDAADHDFVRDGCLVMILAMAGIRLTGSGAYINPYIPACREAIASLVLEGEEHPKTGSYGAAGVGRGRAERSRDTRTTGTIVLGSQAIRPWLLSPNRPRIRQQSVFPGSGSSWPGRTSAVQQTGHANEGLSSFNASPRVSRLLSFVVRRRSRIDERGVMTAQNLAGQPSNGATERLRV